MFIVSLTYIKPLDEVDRHLAAHQDFLHTQYENGTFLASGPMQPRTGGIILARAQSLAQLQAELAHDPFHVHGVASYSITQFTVRAAAPGLEALIES